MQQTIKHFNNKFKIIESRLMQVLKEKITTNEDADKLAKYAALNPYSAIPYHEEKAITTLKTMLENFSSIVFIV